MATDTQNVAAFKPDKVTGGISYGPLNAVLPTDATTPLDQAFKALGYISEEGIQPSRDTSIDKLKAWGGDVVAALLTDDSQGFVFKAIEIFSENANKFLFGDSNVTFTAAAGASNTKIAITDKGYKIEDCVLVFDMFHGDKKARVVVPIADCAVTGEDPYVDGALTGFEVTVEALKDVSGTRVYRYYELDDAPGV